MPVRPLYQCILYTGINRVAFPECYRNFYGVNYMEYCYGYPCCNVKPDCNVKMFFSSFKNCSEHIYTEGNPGQSDCDINRPFKFSIFFTCCISENQRNCCGNNY